MASTPFIKTVTFPSAELLNAVEPLPDGMRGAVWDLQGEPQDIEPTDVEAVVLPHGMGIPAGLMRKAPGLKLVHTQTTGYDGIREAVGEGVAVASADGLHAESTAELALALILASLRGIDDAVRSKADASWVQVPRLSLLDRKVLLIGVGGIGTEIAARLAPFGVELTRVASTAREDEAGHVHGSDELVQLAAEAEVLVIITLLNEHTRHLVNAEVLAAMPDGALVVNVARGAVVDSEALTAEVVSGRLHAALDVFDPEPIPADHPLWTSNNAIITPHVGGRSSALMPRMVRLLKDQLTRVAAGELPRNLVQAGPFKDIEPGGA